MIGDSEYEPSSGSRISYYVITDNMYVNACENQHVGENREVNEVKLLGSVKRNIINISDCEPPPNADLNLNVSGLTSILNISGLTENIPICFSEVQQLLLKDSEAQYSDQAGEKQRALENREVNEEKFLGNVKHSNTINISDCEPPPNPDSSINVSGLTSFLNISGLTENISLNISEIQQHLPQDSEAQDNDQIMATEDFLEDEDFSPSDGSDFDPKKTAYNISDDNFTEDEYYDNPMVTEKSKCLRKKQKGKWEKLEKEEEENEKLQNKKENVVSPKKNQDETNNKKIVQDTKGKRIWNRRNACFYCQELVTNFSRHLLRHHANEIEVIRYKSINDKDPKIRKQKRQAITDKLRNKGNFIHNSKVSFDRNGDLTLLPSKRNTQATSSPSSYATCKICLGTFKRMTFFRHFRKCDASNNENKLPSLKKRVLYNHSITIIPNTALASSELRDNILSHLRSDEISLVVKNDPLILAYGSRLLKKKKERRSRKAICSKLRDLANLLTILRKKDISIQTLSDALEPEKYEIFIDSVKTMCGFDEETGTVNITSIPARMRPAILGCVDILYTQSIMSTESTAYKEAYKKKLDDFKHLIEINWQWEISSNAEKTRKRINMTKESVMPLEEDIATVMRKIHELEIKYADKLKIDRDVLNYESLCIVTIAHIIMLDRKRAGDVSEAELTFYINRKREKVPEKVLDTLTSQQKKTIDDLDVFQIPGKRTRAVPILLTKTMRENIDLIIACREDLNIPSSNRYLFARPCTEEPFDGGKCLDKIKKQCNLKRPEMLTSTGMRHHIATMSQIHAKQNDQYTEHLARFLGHDVSVHASNYRLPMQVLQKAVVGTQLIEYEKTIAIQKNNNKIETITLHQENQEQIIENLETPLNENEQPRNVIKHPDRTNENYENSTDNIDFFHLRKNLGRQNEEPENRIGNRKIDDRNENDCVRSEEINKNHQEDYENTKIMIKENNKKRNQINNKISTKFLPRNKIAMATSCSSLSNSDETLDQIAILNTDCDLQNDERQERSLSFSNENHDDKVNLYKQRLENSQTKIKSNIKKGKNEEESNQREEAYCSSESDDAQKTKTIANRKRIQSKKKKPKVPGLSDRDDEEKPFKQRSKTKHRKWSEEEIKAVRKHFQTNINKKVNPGKGKCMDILKKEPVLRNRTWMQLNTYVNNIYMKK